jgi:hypothetical protein
MDSKPRKTIKLFLLFALLFLPNSLKAVGLGEDLAGMILLNVESKGEAWYVNPVDNKRYYLGRPADAFQLMRELGLGITNFDFQKIAQAGMDVSGDKVLASRLSGRIIIETEKNGEAWYIYPEDLKKYYLGRPNDAFRIMRELGLGITRENLAKIHKPGYDESINAYSDYSFKKEIIVGSDKFYADIIRIDLKNPNLKIITEGASPDPGNKEVGRYGSESLASYVIKNNGFAGMNGSYFCSSSGCGKINYYFFPVFNTNEKRMINSDQFKYWTTGPLFAFDDKNDFYYFKDSREFGSVELFESKYGVKLIAAIGNKPRLIEEYKNLLIDWELDDKQKNTKSLRNAIAYKDNSIYLIIVRDATVPDLAEIMKKLGMEYALNMDGGYSSALFYNDEYMIGPGRDIPNAIIFAEDFE